MKPGVLRIKRAIGFHPFVRSTLDNVTPVNLTVKVCDITLQFHIASSTITDVPF